MHGRTGALLLEQLRKTNWLPPYSEAGIRKIASEIKQLLEPFLEVVQTYRATLNSNPSHIAAVVLYYRSIQRNKRLALAYLYNRIARLIAFRWDSGPGAAARVGDVVSGGERDFLRKYERLLGEYCEKVNLDLAAEILPPKDLFVEVRVVKDCGRILTDGGVVELAPGTVHFLKRVDVEMLIRRGDLVHVA